MTLVVECIQNYVDFCLKVTWQKEIFMLYEMEKCEAEKKLGLVLIYKGGLKVYVIKYVNNNSALPD